MSQYKDVAVGGTVYFWFAANTTAGAAGDGATPLFDVRKAGDTASTIPVASGTPTLLTHANYTDGLHEIAIDTTGYTTGAEYAVFCTLTISSVNPSGFVGSFVVRAASSTVYDMAKGAYDIVNSRLPAALTGAGNMKSDALAINASTIAAAQLAKSAATIVSGAAITGTLSTTQMTTDLTETTDNHYKGRIIIWTSGALQNQATDITAYNGTTKMFTYTATTEAPSNTDTFIIV